MIECECDVWLENRMVEEREREWDMWKGIWRGGEKKRLGKQTAQEGLVDGCVRGHDGGMLGLNRGHELAYFQQKKRAFPRFDIDGFWWKLSN